MSTATLSQAHKPKPTTRLPWAFVLSIALASFLVVLAFGFMFFEIYFSSRVMPGVSVWHVDLSGQTLDEAAATLNAAFDARLNSARIDLIDGARTFTVNPIDLGVRFDARATAQAAVNAAHSGLGVQAEALLDGSDLSPRILIDQHQARAFFTDLAAKINQEPRDAGLQLNSTTLVTTP